MGPAAHVFVEDPAAPVLDEADRHHLARVLRLRPGEAVTVSDGRGAWCAGHYRGAGRVEADGPLRHDPALAPGVTVGFALIKGDRPEWVVQKLTEVGVDRIVPFVAQRSVVRWEDAKAARQLDRLRAVARGAAMQSRRVWLPIVDEVTTTAALVAELAAAGTGALAHPGGSAPGLDRPAVLIGPEGGWSHDELDAGLGTVALGPTVLRAETAAVAAGVLLCALRVGLVDPHP